WGSFLFFYSHPMGEFEKSLKAMVSGVLMGVYYVFVNNTGLNKDRCAIHLFYQKIRFYASYLTAAKNEKVIW
ncbi:MAG: hypothetical protein Q8O06_07935, partial [Acetobacterium sp.]|nr:hypothetical protein [Acetobacterium sp.]